MNKTNKILRKQCYRVLDILIHQSITSKTERTAAETIREHGINGDFQEKVLAEACDDCGMQEECRYADECEIGNIEWRPPAIPSNRLKND
jgi:hypothetical protein